MNPIEHLAFRARLDADTIAVVSQGRVLTFGELAATVRGTAGKLRRMGIRPGQTIGLYVNDPLAHWILLLALFHEAATSCSAHPDFGPLPAAVAVDAYVTERVLPFMGATPVVQIDAAWMQGLANTDAGITPHDYPDASAIARIVCSSGTTGEPKAIPLRVGTIERRVEREIVTSRTGPGLSMMTLSTVGGFATPFRGLVSGLTTHFAYTPAAVERAITLGGVTEMLASPTQLAALVAYLERRTTRLPTLRQVSFAGSTLPAALLRRLRQVLCPTTAGVYGSTEAGGVARAGAVQLERYAGCAGFVLPGCTVELVDETGRRVSDGAEGTVRIRTQGMADEYLGDPVGTAAAFRDGWFHPGDRGRFADDGALLITGRETELVNLGGSKINPALIDDYLCEQAGIRDAAAFAVDQSDGMQQLWAAVVVEREIDVAVLLEACRRRFGAKGPSRIFALDAIPRNAMGKIPRAEVRAKVLETASR